jgi:hypothetical protein
MGSNLIKLVVGAAIVMACLPYLVSRTGGGNAWIWLALLALGLLFTRNKVVMLVILLLVFFFGIVKYGPFSDFVNRSVNRIPQSVVQRSQGVFNTAVQAANPIQWVQNVIDRTNAQGQQAIARCMAAYASQLGRKDQADKLCGPYTSTTDNRTYAACLLTNVVNDPPNVQAGAMTTCNGPVAAQQYIDNFSRNTARQKICDWVPAIIQPYVGLSSCASP